MKQEDSESLNVVSILRRPLILVHYASEDIEHERRKYPGSSCIKVPGSRFDSFVLYSHPAGHQLMTDSDVGGKRNIHDCGVG